MTITKSTSLEGSHHAALGVPVRARESRGAVEVAGSAVDPCVKTEWFWCVREVGQSRAEVPDLPCLTDAAG